VSGGRPEGTVPSRGRQLHEPAKGRWPGGEKGGSDSRMSTQRRTLAKFETDFEVMLNVSVVPCHEKCP